MSHLNNSYAAVPTLLTTQQKTSLEQLAQAFRKAYPEVEDMTAELADKDLTKLDDKTSDESTLGTCFTNGCDDICVC